MVKTYIRNEYTLDPQRGVLIIEEYKTDDLLDRNDGPAKITRIGNSLEEYYYRMGKMHRDDGPAEIWTDLNTGIVTRECYAREGRLVDSSIGPAYIFRDKNTGQIVRQVWYDGEIKRSWNLNENEPKAPEKVSNRALGLAHPAPS